VLEYDSVEVVAEVNAVAEIEDSIQTETTEIIPKAKKHTTGPWRVTALFTPLYITQTVTPDANDEVLITKANNTGNRNRVGNELAIGVGKALTPRLSLDGQLTLIHTEQAIGFTYSSGLVDTLIAVLQPDNTVLVKPVYHLENREISSEFTYGGIRFGVTYYLKPTNRGRFNIAAAGGMNYMISSEIKENLNGNWISLSTDKPAKLNYSLLLGAGYNLKLTKGWEFMISPSMTYYTNSVRIESLPYNLNQRSFGIMFMLSKTLGLQ
jgi:hypothetical protein